MNDQLSYVEASVPVGAALIVLGGLTWFAQYSVGMFTSWIWAIMVGGLWLLFGALLLFSDIRLYQYDRSPVEMLLTDSQWED